MKPSNVRLPKWRIFDQSKPPRSLGVCEAATEADALKKAKRFPPPITIVPAYRGAEVTIP